MVARVCDVVGGGCFQLGENMKQRRRSRNGPGKRCSQGTAPSDLLLQVGPTSYSFQTLSNNSTIGAWSLTHELFFLVGRLHIHLPYFTWGNYMETRVGKLQEEIGQLRWVKGR
jgi:hypothetical protein